MKTCDEMLNSLYERRAQYVTAQRKKKKVLASAGATLCAVSLLGGSVWYLNRPQHDIPVVPATDDGTVTTTVAAPTEGENTTTTITTVNTTAPAPTTSQKPLVITADEPDVFENVPLGTPKRNGKCISSALQEKMKVYENENVVYSVIVEVPLYSEDYSEFWHSTEELAQFHKEYYDVYYTFYDEAKRLNPTWDGTNVDYIRVWTEELRENYQYWLTLIAKWRALENQYRESYHIAILDQRVQILDDITGKERIPISDDTRFFAYFSSAEYAFFMELTADEINALAECGGYIIRLVFPDGDKGNTSYVPF